MNIVLTSLAYYAGAAALVVGTERCVKALSVGHSPRLGLAIFLLLYAYLLSYWQVNSIGGDRD